MKACLITGVGPGTGSELVRRFSRGGYSIAMLARSKDRLDSLSLEISDAHGYVCDVSSADSIEATYEAVKSDIGPPSVIIHNAVYAEHGTYMEIRPEGLRQAFEVNTMALLHLARLATPDMLSTGAGAIVCTGNTSAYRGRSRFAGFAPSKAAQRILLESIAREMGPKGIHAAYVAIDAVIDVPWARERFSSQPDSFFCQPADIADECYRIAHQPKSAWSSESIIRPYGEPW